MIRIRNLGKDHGRTTVLDGIDLDLPRGGVTALVGPNGAGKSTLLSLIARLDRPDRGSVTVDGLDVQRTPGAQLARRLAILRQDNHLTARLSVRDLVGFGRFPHCGGRPGPEDHAAVARALDYLELTPLADRFLDQLSGGQRQRAFVAMVLAQDTDYLLLDEPLNNLDMRHAQAMMRLLARTARDLGKTVLVVLHDINFAACHADRIVALKGGRLFAHGTPDELICPVVLGTLYDMEVPVHRIEGRNLALVYG
ncbi:MULTISPECIES: iron ABC transporter ATP-binding protein [unclassified Paracoccus (in: a-proteobacteria)]|uniref:iron ABC transporter ATP-binding protein n=1 Tax=unclassified Paracoccus (in: a-proteobacteria) TaxID=2688777 RepID=UPI0012B2CE38|nr:MULTISPECIES: ATP-binding cassette domain-containing protein [unclassified Paracoccus (in: a-proteobacteria)]UXU76655.1 ATP-binding cassette domain-containing protein [Paracoccus sp. SMMA_5]UXU82544.1 ATP-binding cassette domain-containing protein [Paracoccus sp. SMMA_5_TC]